MRNAFLAVLAFLLSAAPSLVAQSDAASAETSPTSPSASSPQESTQQSGPTEIEKAVFTHRSKLPDSPRPKAKNADEDTACPSGEGHPCALLGGRPYFRDSWHITEHEKTWWEAFKTPGMAFSTGMLFASSVVDIEGTQHCLAAGTCRELNPVMGKTRARQYAVAMPMNGFATWVAVREKQHGRGVLPFFMFWTLSSVHLYYGVNGLMPQKVPR